jgi:para-nitrobenzyl esterase
MMAAGVRVEQGDLQGTDDDAYTDFSAFPTLRRRWGICAGAARQMAGPRAATGFGAACPQPAGAVGDLRVAHYSEDCLFLNVWTRMLQRGADQQP